MSDLEYLEAGLVEGKSLREESAKHARRVANTWVAAGVNAACVEVLSEQLARWAYEIGDDVVTTSLVLTVVAYLELPEAVTELLAKAVGEGATATQLAGLAVHIVDISEAMALRVFVAELPALSAKSDRSGDAARKVGLARHLKG